MPRPSRHRAVAKRTILIDADLAGPLMWAAAHRAQSQGDIVSAALRGHLMRIAKQCFPTTPFGGMLVEWSRKEGI